MAYQVIDPITLTPKVTNDTTYDVTIADAATLRHAATAYSLIFGECAERYTGLAEKATRHVSDIQTLTEAGAKP